MPALLPSLAVSALKAPWSDGATDLHTLPSGTADVFRSVGDPRATVILLHGWSDRTPRNYLEWIRHLTASGVAVVFPRYQDSLRSSRRQMLAGAEVGVRDGLEALGADTGPVIAAGYSFGAGLAVVAAAESDRWGMPLPRTKYGNTP